VTDVSASASAGLTRAGLVRRADHIALAVPDLAAACHLYGDVLGGELIAGGDDAEKQVRTAQYRFPPGIKVELLQPLSPGSYLQRYLDRHGPGFHHLTFFVHDVAATAAALVAAGYEVVDTDLSRPWWQETFVRPRSGFGALLQLATPDPPQGPHRAGITVDDILEGRLVWHRAQPRPAGEAIVDG
jgi:methylmalonyl-CoA/ethylmalonyl-CoA epimerase